MLAHDVLGLAGVGAILIAYALLQADKLASDDYRYLLLNGGGAGLVLLSLVNDFNLSAFLLEIIWLAITLYGLAKRWNRGHAMGANGGRGG